MVRVRREDILRFKVTVCLRAGGSWTTQSSAKATRSAASSARRLSVSERADEMGERGFQQAHQLIAMDGALLLQAFLLVDRGLCGEAAKARVDGRADHRGEAPAISNSKKWP